MARKSGRLKDPNCFFSGLQIDACSTETVFSTTDFDENLSKEKIISFVFLEDREIAKDN